MNAVMTTPAHDIEATMKDLMAKTGKLPISTQITIERLLDCGFLIGSVHETFITMRIKCNKVTLVAHINFDPKNPDWAAQATFHFEGSYSRRLRLSGSIYCHTPSSVRLNAEAMISIGKLLPEKAR